MKLVASCPVCKTEGYDVRLPLTAYTTEEGSFLGYCCHVCGGQTKATDKPHLTHDEAEEELHRIIWEDQRETGKADRPSRSPSYGQA